MTLGCFLICLPAALAFMAPCTVAGRIYSPHTDPSLPTAHPSSSEPLSSPAPTLCSCRARTHPAGLAVFVRCRCLSEWLISPPQAQVPPQIKCVLSNTARVHPASLLQRIHPFLPQQAALISVCLQHNSGQKEECKGLSQTLQTLNWGLWWQNSPSSLLSPLGKNPSVVAAGAADSEVLRSGHFWVKPPISAQNPLPLWVVKPRQESLSTPGWRHIWQISGCSEHS